MSYSNRYTSGCGCSKSVKMWASRNNVPCCNRAVQQPPSPCCEPHITIIKPGVCFRPTCAVAATYPDHFFIAFKNQCDEEVPISLGNVFFYSQSAGFLNIHLFNGTSYEVSLVDPEKVGAVIEEDACVIVQASFESEAPTTQRCLSGQFVAPALNASQTIFVLNGSGIPIGSTLTFTAEGDTGSYLVTAFISASGNIYAYTVQNTGSGLPPGTIVDGGTSGACVVPIEIVTDVDICDLSEAEAVDTITGCLNGSPRGFVPAGEDYVPRGTSEGTWDQAKFTNFDCCVFIEGCLKFSGNGCTEAQDTVIVGTVGVECFTEAFEAAEEGDSTLTAIVEGIPIIVLDWDENTRELTVRPANEDYLPEGETFIEFPEGTAICLGECCRQCTNGPQLTKVLYNQPDPEFGPTFGFITPDLTLPTVAGTFTEYLVGYNTSGVVTALLITDTYNDDLEPGIGKPSHSDPLMIRQKICTTQVNGCPQSVETKFNFELGFLNLPEGCRAHWQFGSFAADSDTLADGTTPNPFFNVSSQAAAAGHVDGPSVTSTFIANTSIGFGNTSDLKVFPYVAGIFNDFVQMVDCECGNQIIWFYVLLQAVATLEAGTVNIGVSIRRVLEKENGYYVSIPENDPDLEGFNN